MNDGYPGVLGPLAAVWLVGVLTPGPMRLAGVVSTGFVFAGVGVRLALER